MALCHLCKRAVAFGLISIPMQPFPIFAQDLAHGVARRQRDTNAEASLGAGCGRVYQVMLVAIVHVGAVIVAGEQYTETPDWR